MLPPPVPSPADLCDAATWPTRVPPGHEVVFGTEPRPCVPPPPDDRYDVVRGWVLTMLPDLGAATVLARRAPLGDREAWEAVGSDLLPQYRQCSRVCDALAAGNLDGALRHAANFCGDYTQAGDDGPLVPLVDEWLSGARAELARKAGAL